MKLDPRALEAMLKALQQHSLMDMADDKPMDDGKISSALEGAEEIAGEDLDDDDEEGEDPEHMAAIESDKPEEEEDDEVAKLRDFMKSRGNGPTTRPGTAVMIATEKRKPMPMKGKKSIRDMMNG